MGVGATTPVVCALTFAVTRSGLDSFAALIQAVDLFLIEAFSVVPAECIVGRRLGFFYELCAMLTLPLITFFVVMLMALLVYGCELHANRRLK